MSVQRLLSKFLGVDVAAMNDGHGLGCPCPKHRAEVQERERRIAREGFPPGSLGAAIDDAISAKVGRDLLAKHDKGPRP